MALTKEQFQDACSYLTLVGSLTGTGPLFIDGNAQIVLDEGNANANITPDETTVTQALVDLAASQDIEAESVELKALAKTEIQDYLKAELVKETHAPIATIKSNIVSAIGSNVKAQNAISNIANLYGYDDSTNAGYLQCALLAVAILVD